MKKILQIVLLLSLLPKLHAVVLVSNITNATPFGSSVADTSWLADSFTTDAQSYTLNNVNVDMDATTGGGNFVLSIFDDNSGEPGSLITNGTLSGETNPNLDQVYTYITTATVNLAASTTYWVVAAETLGTNFFSWSATFDAAESGTGTIGDVGKFSSNQGVSWNNNTIIQRFSVDVTAVPEPSDYAAIFGIGAIVLVYYRRRFKS